MDDDAVVGPRVRVWERKDWSVACVHLPFSRILPFLNIVCSWHLYVLKSLKSSQSLKSFSDEPYVSELCVCKHLAHAVVGRPSWLSFSCARWRIQAKAKAKSLKDSLTLSRTRWRTRMVAYSVYVSLMFSESYDLNYSCESYDLWVLWSEVFIAVIHHTWRMTP